MEPALTWIDLTASDRDQMRRVLDLFKEQGTLDEMGLGSLRDVLSDALFPGTFVYPDSTAVRCSSCLGSTSGWKRAGSGVATSTETPATRKSI